MCFTFLAAQGHQIGDSLCEQDQIDTCARLLAQPKPIHLPTDVTALGPGDEIRQAGVDLPAGWKGLDIGPGTAAAFSDVILDARTVFWNGPMGVFEQAAFAEGTRAIAKALIEIDGLSVVGGGDSAAAVRQLGFDEAAFGHISTGGGASLEYLEGKTLPGLSVLAD